MSPATRRCKLKQRGRDPVTITANGKADRNVWAFFEIAVSGVVGAPMKGISGLQVAVTALFRRKQRGCGVHQRDFWYFLEQN